MMAFLSAYNEFEIQFIVKNVNDKDCFFNLPKNIELSRDILILSYLEFKNVQIQVS